MWRDKNHLPGFICTESATKSENPDIFFLLKGSSLINEILRNFEFRVSALLGVKYKNCVICKLN